MTVYDGDLYIGGGDNRQGDDDEPMYVGKYDKTSKSFTSITGGIKNKVGEIFTMTVYDGGLYIGGGNDGQMYVAKYDKTKKSFTQITGGIPTNDNYSSISGMYNYAPPKNKNLALILGASIGGGVALIIIIALIVYYVRKN